LKIKKAAAAAGSSPNFEVHPGGFGLHKKHKRLPVSCIKFKVYAGQSFIFFAPMFTL